MNQALSVRARRANDELFSRYDRLNELWTQAEERLTAHHVPVPVRFTYQSYYPNSEYERYGCKCHRMLGLRKIKGSWRICHGIEDDRHPDEEDWTPITECSAQVRIKAAKFLPQLEEAVVKSAEEFVPVVDKAIQELADYLESPSDIQELLAERAKLNGKH